MDGKAFPFLTKKEKGKKNAGSEKKNRTLEKSGIFSRGKQYYISEEYKHSIFT